jgi:hypothetical protein
MRRLIQHSLKALVIAGLVFGFAGRAFAVTRQCVEFASGAPVDCVNTSSTDLTTASTWIIGDNTGDITLTWDGLLSTGTISFDDSEAAFNFSNVIRLLVDAAPVTDTAGDVAFDTNAWGAGRGAVQVYDGTASGYLVAILTSETCNAGDRPNALAGGAWDCVPDADSGAPTIGIGQAAYATAANTIGGEAAYYYDPATNTLYVDAIVLAPTPTPTIGIYDSDGVDADQNGNISGNLTDTGSGAEDFDIFIKQQIAGVLTTVMTFDADGTISTDAGRVFNAGALTEGSVAVYNDDEIDASSELLAIVQDETGTGLLVFGTSPNFTTDIGYANSADDDALAAAGDSALNTTDEQLSFHSAADGEISGEASLSLLRHYSRSFDPAAWYDQESVFRSVPFFKVGDDSPEGITITEWRVKYVGGDPTTELDADLICDTTPDFNVAAGATVMDVLDTTAGASTADTGFDSATCANAAEVYLHFGADPTDANVIIAVDIWFYNEED